MGIQIFVSSKLFGARAHETAETGAAKYPQFTWAVAEEVTAWPDHLTDDQWEAQQWLHDALELVIGAPVEAAALGGEAGAVATEAGTVATEAARAEGPPVQAPASPPDAPAVALVARVVRLLEDGLTTLEEGAAALVAVAERRDRVGLTFEVKGAELAQIYRDRATAAEAEAAAVEKRAAEMPPEADAVPPYPAPLGLVHGLILHETSGPAPVAQAPKRGKAAAAKAEADPEAKRAQEALVEAARVQWAEQRELQRQAVRRGMLAAAEGDAAALRGQAAADRWAADHLVAERVYILDPNAARTLFAPPAGHLIGRALYP